MKVTHTVAAALVAALALEGAGLAQAPPDHATTDAEVITIPHQQAMLRLFQGLIALRGETRLRFEVVGGAIVEGNLVQVSSKEVIITSGRLRRLVPMADIVGVRPLPDGKPGTSNGKPGMSNGKAFGVGAAVGGGIGLGLFVAAISH